MNRRRTKFIGVYERASDVRMHKGRPDVCYDITYKAGGRKTWEKVGWLSEGYSAKLAAQIRSERVRSLRHGAELPKQKKQAPTFKELATKYITWAKQNKRSAKDDESRYNRHLASRFDNKRLDEISPFDLERLRSELLREGLAPATAKHVLVLIRQMYNRAWAWGLYRGESPVRGIKIGVVQNQRERFLTYDEADKLLNELKKASGQLHDMALLSLHCGLRAGEVFNLKGQDVNFDTGMILIADPKSGYSRKAFMTEAVREVLSSRMPEEPGQYVFQARGGGKVMTVSQAYRRAVDRLKLNKGIEDPRQMITFHSLRHSFASWLALQGESLMTIRELLGHRSFAMTQRYAHLIPDHKRAAVLRLEGAFNGKKEEVI